MTSRDLLTVELGRQKRRPSQTEDITFASVELGSQGSGMILSVDSDKFDAAGKVFKNIVSGTEDDSAVSKKQMEDYVDQNAGSMLSWQDSVIDRLATPPGSPVTGDRYLVVATATDAWVGQENNIAEWNGSSWDFTTPSDGYAVIVQDETDGVYIYSSGWTKQLWEATEAGAGLQKVGQTISIADEGVSATQISTSAIGDGLTGGGGTPIAAVAEDDSLNVGAGGIKASFTKYLENDNAGAITKGQVVYITQEGKVDLAIATLSGLYERELGVVEDASIDSGSSGNIVVRRGSVIDGYTDLEPGKICYVSRSTEGDIIQDLSGWQSGEMVYEAGHALSSTELIYSPDFIFEY